MDVSINLWAVLAATATQFIAAGIWYTPIFGKKWGEIHDFDKLDKKTQARMQQQMLPLMLAQFVVGAVSAVVLAHFIAALPSVEWWKLAFWLWLGFVLPTQFGAVYFWRNRTSLGPHKTGDYDRRRAFDDHARRMGN